MNEIHKRTVGINFNEEGFAEIAVWAPKANHVSLKTNTLTIELKKVGLGYWKAISNKIKPGNRYKFIINGEKELPDPASLSQPESVHGPSEAVDLKNFEWSDHKWTNHDLSKYIIYELHTGTFSPEGTFKGIEEKLDYLLELGINAIEIMPIAQFPGSRNWGYDSVYPFATQNTYGGPHGFMHLVNLCHNKGIAVILDVVYNHLGPEGNYLEEYAPYFTDKYNTPWGKAVNFDDAWCFGVRNYFIENVLMWFRDFHIDALRLDAVHAIKDLSPRHILKEIRENVDDLMAISGNSHYLIVETDLNDHKFIKPGNKCGYGMDAQWIDEFHHALRVSSGQPQTGYYSDFEGIAHLAKAYKDAYVYSGQYSPHRKKYFGTTTDSNEGAQFIVFSQNHDQVGNRMLGERTSHLVSFEMQKLLAGAVFVSPFLPMLFMGEEWSASTPFQYFISHTDTKLVEAVRNGRREEFEAFHAEGEAPDPQAEDTFNSSTLKWEEKSLESHKKMFSYYKDLIQLRKTNAALKPLRNDLSLDFYEERKLLVLIRKGNDKTLTILLNFSNRIQGIVKEEHFNDLSLTFNSADPKYGGGYRAPEKVTDKIQAHPESMIIYAST